MQQEWVDRIIDFWFGRLTPEQWFSRSDETDEAVRSNFRALHADLLTKLADWHPQNAREALAAIILFDQMPRNMFRGTAAAFSSDPLALRIATEAVERGLDEGLDEDQRSFVYMPFMHSEALIDQERCVELFGTLEDKESIKYAVEHRDIVAAYGRFPHRNRALGRQSSEAETAFLSGHAGFGQ